MVLKVKNKEYYTNITNQELINKCINFYLEGCTSYAISFDNNPEYVITKQKIKNIDCKILKGFNNELKFVPVHAKEAKNIDSLLSKGLDSIEL